MAADEIDVGVVRERVIPRVYIERTANMHASLISRSRDDQIRAQRERFGGDVVEGDQSALNQIDFHEKLHGKQTECIQSARCSRGNPLRGACCPLSL